MHETKHPQEVAAQPPLLLWVFAPHVDTNDPDLACYSDYTQSHAEYDKAFAELDIDWRWQLVRLDNYREVIDEVVRQSVASTPVILNLCDGDELNGVPGVSVIRYLESVGLPYTGADEHFYEITTSKIVMKQAFERASVCTPTWEVIPEAIPSQQIFGSGEHGLGDGIFDRLGTPIIVKPAVSAGSMGITVKSVVHSETDLVKQVGLLHDGYRGWNLTDGGVFAERFVEGREFTTFIVGSAHTPEACTVYPPVERVFHAKLPPTEQFLSFDRLWEIYEHESPLGENEYLWEYAPAPAELVDDIVRVSWDAYAAVGGTGYGRVDLRYDVRTNELFVLEVNAQCGISEDENYTSIGAILRFANATFSSAVKSIIDDALVSHAKAVAEKANEARTRTRTRKSGKRGAASNAA